MFGFNLAIFLVLVLSVNSSKIGKYKNFACDSEDRLRYYVDDEPKDCEKGQSCNLMYAGFKNYCKETDSCFDSFTCIDTARFIVGGYIFECPSYYQCNSKFSWPCQPCVRKTCSNPIFKCDPDDVTLVKYPSMSPLTCMPGYVCNKDYLEPCTACIEMAEDENSEEATTLAPTTTTTTPAPTTPTTTTTPTPTTPAPTTPTTTTPAPTPTTTEDENSEEATTTPTPTPTPTTTPTTTITEGTKPVLPSEILSTNCNDGNGKSYPCRLNKSDSTKYYKCKKVWFTYTRKELNCDQLENDADCKGIPGLCGSVGDYDY